MVLAHEHGAGFDSPALSSMIPTASKTTYTVLLIGKVQFTNNTDYSTHAHTHYCEHMQYMSPFQYRHSIQSV